MKLGKIAGFLWLIHVGWLLTGWAFAATYCLVYEYGHELPVGTWVLLIWWIAAWIVAIVVGATLHEKGAT